MDNRNIQIAVTAVACIGGLIALKRLKERRNVRENWVDPFLQDKEFSDYQIVVKRLRQYNDFKRFKGFLRMSPELFAEILTRVGPKNKKI